MSAPSVQLFGGSYEDLLRAAELSRRGVPVEIREPGLRLGGTYATETFLTPFRFNLGPALVPRRNVRSLGVLEPDPLLAVGGARLARTPVELVPAGTVAETLDRTGVEDPGQRVLLLSLALFCGIDPEAPGSGATLARVAVELDELVAVEGGNGVAVTSLVDEIVAHGGRVVEGLGQSPADDLDGRIGVCRLFVGLRGNAPVQDAFADARGFHDEDSLGRRLGALRSGDATNPVGFVVSNRHLDPQRSGDPLASFVWQGLLALPAEVGRRDYTDSVLEAAGVDSGDVMFSLLWLPSETREALS